MGVGAALFISSGIQMTMPDKKDETHRRPLLSLIVLGCLLSAAPAAHPQATGDLTAAVTCVIAAWNAYDADGARRCYDNSAVAVWKGERHAIDWEFERRLREFDAAARSRFRFEILDARHPDVEFTLYETNELLDALGLERVTARWRYTVRGGLVVEEQLLKADGRFGAALQEFTRWGRERRPEGWTSVTDGDGNVRFDGATAPALIALAREWSRSRGPRSARS